MIRWKRIKIGPGYSDSCSTWFLKWKKGGDKPSDVSFVLSMVATELGLKIMDKSISVFPVVLDGVSQGVANIMQTEKEKMVDEIKSEDIAVDIDNIH